MRKHTTNINEKSLTKSNTSRPSKKSTSTNKDNLRVKSKSKIKSICNNNDNKKMANRSKNKSKSKSQQYSFNLKSNKKKIQQSFVLVTKKDSEEMDESSKKLRDQFQKAIVKVFNILDIFSRGSISEANISRWVPQAAFYFLGSVFQKIRVFRIVMDQPQFKQQCHKIFLKSSNQDIRQFIQSIQKHDNFNEQKVSFEGQQKQTLQSQVEDRFCFQLESGQASFRKMVTLGQKTFPLQTIKSNQMYCDEDQHKQQNKNIINNTNKKNKEKMDKSKIVPLNNLNQFQNVAIKNKEKRVIDVENMPLKVTDKGKTSKQKSNTANGGQSPFFKGSITSVLAKVGSKKKQSVDRIDKLSMRLQDYIKQNAERLQRSKNCRIGL